MKVLELDFETVNSIIVNDLVLFNLRSDFENNDVLNCFLNTSGFNAIILSLEPLPEGVDTDDVFSMEYDIVVARYEYESESEYLHDCLVLGLLTPKEYEEKILTLV